MNKELSDIIKSSSFEIQQGYYVYAKVSKYPETRGHFLVSEDQEEITVVTKMERLEELELIERNKEDYVLIMLNVSIPFYSVGFLATVSSAIADKGCNVLIVSTYSKDYVMVRKEQIEKATEVLLELGFKEEK